MGIWSGGACGGRTANSLIKQGKKFRWRYGADELENGETGKGGRRDLTRFGGSSAPEEDKVLCTDGEKR